MKAKDKFQIYYWKDELYVEWYDWALQLKFNGDVIFDIDGEYYGPPRYIRELNLCDLVGFIELMKEWRQQAGEQ